MDAYKLKSAEIALVSALSSRLGARIRNYEDMRGHNFYLQQYDTVRIILICKTCGYGIRMGRHDLVFTEDIKFSEVHCRDTVVEELLDSVTELAGLSRAMKMKAFTERIIEPD